MVHCSESSLLKPLFGWFYRWTIYCHLLHRSSLGGARLRVRHCCHCSPCEVPFLAEMWWGPPLHAPPSHFLLLLLVYIYRTFFGGLRMWVRPLPDVLPLQSPVSTLRIFCFSPRMPRMFTPASVCHWWGLVALLCKYTAWPSPTFLCVSLYTFLYFIFVVGTSLISIFLVIL